MRRPTFTRRLDALATLRDPTRLRLYEYVERRLDGVGRDEAAAAIGVTRAMAAFHLDRLVGAGLLRAQYRRLSGRTGRGAGRPSKLYRRSRREFGVTVPTRDHELLARLLVGAAGGVSRLGAIDREAHRRGLALGRRARKKLTRTATPSRVTKCVEDVLEEIGFEPVRARSGEVRARNCPFDPLSRTSPEVVCRAAHSMVQGVIDGVGPGHVTLRRDANPDRCCVVLTPHVISPVPTS